MTGMLKPGTYLKSNSSNVYLVISLLGAGGQGEVYEVECGNTRKALKWYYKNTATPLQKTILEKLISRGEPDSSFLFPQDMIIGDYGQFGYVMPLRPPNFKGIVDMMKRRAEPTFKSLCRAAFNLTKGYEKLHSMGYAYRDISFGNVFLNPDNGDVLICDNDNVSAANCDNSSVYGTPRFMAPEIVVGKAKPSRNTDLYSLAVLLFYMFMLNHPLEGKLEAEIKCMDIPAMKKLYGTDPVFIFDPNDKRNRPLPGYQDNALIYWDLYPSQIRDLFVQSFTTGLINPSKRITEKQWMNACINLYFEIMYCSCGAEVFYNKNAVSNGRAITCWNCKKKLSTPIVLTINKAQIPISSETKIYSHHTQGDYNIDKLSGSVVQNKNNPNLWGLRNEETTNWKYIKTDGTQLIVEPGRTALIASGVKIDFGQVIGEIK